MLSDIVIAQAAKMLPIAKVAEKLGLTDEDLIPYGRPPSAPPLLAREKPPPVLAWRTP